MLKIYWHPLSTPANKVIMCANALSLTFDKVLVDLQKGEQMGDAYRQLNPFGKVPAIDDDGFVLYESGAILRYLARKEKSDLYPSTYKERAIVDQWADFASHMVLFAVQKVFFHRVLAPMLGETPDESIALQGIAQMKFYLPIVNERLGESKYLAGNAITLADISLISVLDSVELIDFSLDEYPSLNKWREDLLSQDFYTATHEYYAEGIFPPKA